MSSQSSLVGLARADLLELPVALLLDACELAGIEVVDDHTITWTAGHRAGPSQGSSFSSLKEAALDALERLSVVVHLSVVCKRETSEATHQYMWCDAWSHCFIGDFADTVRWVFSISENKVLHAQVQRGAEWFVLSPQETADLSDSLTAGNDLPASSADFENVAIGSLKPGWALMSVVAPS